MVFFTVICIVIAVVVQWYREIRPRDVAWEHFKEMNPHADHIEYWRYCLDKQQKM